MCASPGLHESLNTTRNPIYVPTSTIALRLEAHIARIEGRQTPGPDRRTARHVSYAVGQRKRKRVEKIFGWVITVGGLRRSRFVGIAKTRLAAYRVEPHTTCCAWRECNEPRCRRIRKARTGRHSSKKSLHKCVLVHCRASDRRNPMSIRPHTAVLQQPVKTPSE